MAQADWHEFDDGATIGQQGSEGIVVRDEEHALGARITLERETGVAPFAITCGIYGWMMHTRFFAAQDEAETEYERMKSSLGKLLESAEQTAEIDGGKQVLFDGIAAFIENYP